MEFRVLGPMEVWDGECSVDLGSRMPRAVLALLIMDAGRVVSLDRLIDKLWGDEPPATATTALQGYVSQLRRALEPNRQPRTPPTVLVTQPPGYVLRVAPQEVDAARFEALAAEGRSLLASGRPGPGRERLRRALALWRGPPYAEFAFEPFAQEEVVRLGELRAGAEEALAEAELEVGEHAGAVAELERLVATEPLRERRWELLALALYRCGRQAEALRALDKARRTLGEELGIEPGPSLRQLERDLLAQAPSLDWHPPELESAPVAVTHPRPPEHEATSVDSGLGPATPELVRLVGRAAEIGRLEEVLRRLDGGQGAVVLISGEPGIGKTRLVEEVAARATERGTTVAWGQGYEGEAAAPLWPWVEIVRTVASVEDRDLVREALAPGAAHIAQLLPEIKEVVGDVEPPPLLLGEEARRGLYNAVTGFLLRMAAERPILIVVDDAHWADVPSLHLLELVTQQLRRVPLGLVVTYRDVDVDAHHPLTATLARLARQPLVRVPLTGLAPEDVAGVITSLTGAEPEPEMARALHSRTEGNPLFVTELARLLQSEGRLQAVSGERWDVPAGVRDVIRQRLRRLPEEALTLLRTAAVIGRDFDLDVLIATAGIDEEQVFDGVEAGLLIGVLAESSTAPGRYRFSHVLVQETLYSELSGLGRIRLHRRVASAILEVRGDGREHVVELAHHFWQARSLGGAEQALEYAERAAQQALASHAYEHAEEQLGRARELVEQLPSGPDRVAHELRLHLVLKKVLSITKGFATAELGDVASRARDIAKELGDTRQMVASLWGMWAFRCVGGQFASAQELAGQLLELADHEEDIAFRLAGHYTSGVTAWHCGDQEMARRHLDRAIDVCDRADTALLSETLREYIPGISTRCFSALVLSLLGEDELARQRTSAALALAREAGDPFAEAFVLLFDAWCSLFRRMPDETLQCAGEALVIAQKHGLGLWIALGSILRGWARAVMGQGGEGVPEIQAGLAGMEGAGARMLRHFVLALLAEAHWRAGEQGTALEMIDAALTEAQSSGECFYLAEALRLRAGILADGDRGRSEAKAHLVEAADVARAQHAELLELRVTTDLAALSVDRGSTAERG